MNWSIKEAVTAKSLKPLWADWLLTNFTTGTDYPNACVCWLSSTTAHWKSLWSERSGCWGASKCVCECVLNDLLRMHYTHTFLLYNHGVIIVVVLLLASRGRGPTAAAEQRQLRARGLRRRRSQRGGGGGGGVWGGGQGGHSGSDLAVHSQLAAVVLRLSGDDTQTL